MKVLDQPDRGIVRLSANARGAPFGGIALYGLWASEQVGELPPAENGPVLSLSQARRLKVQKMHGQMLSPEEAERVRSELSQGRIPKAPIS